MQGISAEMQAQLGARDVIIEGLIRDKGLIEEQNRVRTEGLRVCLISWIGGLIKEQNRVRTEGLRVYLILWNWGFDQGAEPGACRVEG